MKHWIISDERQARAAGRKWALNGMKFKCPVCGYWTGAQGAEFNCCPICMEQLRELPEQLRQLREGKE